MNRPICPKCGRVVQRHQPAWINMITKTLCHDPCPPEEDQDE